MIKVDKRDTKKKKLLFSMNYSDKNKNRVIQKIKNDNTEKDNMVQSTNL